MASARKRMLDLETDESNKRAKEVAATAGGISPYTGKPYSQRYYDILQKRQGECRVGMVCSCEDVYATTPRQWHGPG